MLIMNSKVLINFNPITKYISKYTCSSQLINGLFKYRAWI